MIVLYGIVSMILIRRLSKYMFKVVGNVLLSGKLPVAPMRIIVDKEEESIYGEPGD